MILTNIDKRRASRKYIPLPLSNILRRWKLDGNALDTKGLSNGTATAVTYQQGVINQSAGFATSNSVIDCGNSMAPDMLGNTSMSFLFKPNLIARRSLISYGSHETWGTFVIQANGWIYFYFTIPSASSTNINSIPYVMTADNWGHIIITRDYTNMIYKLYINGVKISEYLLQPGDTQSTPSNTDFIIGDGYRDNAIGDFDDVIIWDKSLTEQEAYSLAKQQMRGIDIEI